MHETAIAESLAGRVEAIARERGLKRVTAVGVRVGMLRAVVDSTLTAIYAELVRGTDLEDSRLEILPGRVRSRCPECGWETRSSRPVLSCARCGSGKMVVSGGRELLIEFLETEE